MNFNIDKMNFLYFYVGNVKHYIKGRDNKSLWIYNIMAQIVLPKDVKMTANYNVLSKKADFYYIQSEKPFNHGFDLTFTKKFMSVFV